jgi:hypothetical protein
MCVSFGTWSAHGECTFGNLVHASDVLDILHQVRSRTEKPRNNLRAKASCDFGHCSETFAELLESLQGGIGVLLDDADTQRTFSTLIKSFTLQLLAWIRDTIRSKSGRPFVTSVKSTSKVGLSSRSWTASSLHLFSHC